MLFPGPQSLASQRAQLQEGDEPEADDTCPGSWEQAWGSINIADAEGKFQRLPLPLGLWTLHPGGSVS